MSLGKSKKSRTNVNATAVSLGIVVMAMGGLAFASEPLYRIFCSVTGYGGTTQVAETVIKSDDPSSEQMITVQLDGTVHSGLSWKFRPLQNEMKLKVGEEVLAFYEATNNTDKPIVGTATFNVTPHKAGVYFNKIQCFCFTEQVLRPGETAQLPVTFFVDPEMMKDKNTNDVRTITLSYTFFKSKDQSALKNADTASAGSHFEPTDKKNGNLGRRSKLEMAGKITPLRIE